jgi:hypothetical protein
MAFVFRSAILVSALVLALPSALLQPITAQAPPADEAAGGEQGGWSLEQHRALVAYIRDHLKVPASWRSPRNDWGHPNLEGVWTSDSVHGVPRDRQARFGDRMFLNEAELAERAAAEEQTRVNAINASGAQTAGRDRAWRGNITFPLTSLIVDPPNGRTPAVTPQAERRRAPRDRGSFGEGPFETLEDFTLYDRCITRGIVGGVLPVSYGNGNRIIQTPDSVVIAYEMIHDTRIVPVDGRSPLTNRVRQYLGDSRGRWEGDTLVIETTNFTDRTSIGPNGNGLRHSDEMKLIEQFTRVGEDVLVYDMTMIDPKTYTRPFTIATPLVAPPGFQLLPYDCHEGNEAIYNIMRGQRAEDRAIEEDRARGIIRPRRPVQGDIDLN